MKLSLFVFAALAASVAGSQVTRQLGPADWDMNDVVNDAQAITQASGIYTLSFKAENGGLDTNGVANANVVVKVFATCPHGSVPLATQPNLPVGQLYPTGVADLSGINVSNENINLLTTYTSGTGTASTMNFNMDLSDLPSTLKTVSGDNTIVKMCVRVELWDSSAEPEIWNFREIDMTATYDLINSFDGPASFKTVAYVPKTAAFDFQYSTNIGFCDNSGDLFNQGQVICLDICPGAADLTTTPPTYATPKVEAILAPGMTIKLVNPNSNNDYLANKYKPDGAFLIAENADTPTATVSNSATCVEVRFLLPSDFFKSDDVPGVDAVPIQLKASGKVQVEEHTSRRLGRGLQEIREEGPTDDEFEKIFLIMKNSGGESGAWTIGFGAAGAAAAGAALLL